MIEMSVNVVMTPQEFVRRHEARNKRVLFKSGAYNRTAMQRSMRYTKNPKKHSQPGQPPLAHKDNPKGPQLRKRIFFRVNEADQSVIIGPPTDAGSNVPETLDKGGRVKARQLKKVEYEVGEYGPIRYKGAGKFYRILLETPDQVQRAIRLTLEQNATRQSVGAHIQPRPFTAPRLTDGGENLKKLIAREPL